MDENMQRIVFVCTGNLCRSPMAEYALQNELARRGVNDTLVESAGTLAIDGASAAGKAVSEMKKHGIDMGPHRARILTGEMIRDADIIVVMEHYHREAVLAFDPSSANKTIMMGSLLDGESIDEIPDPYGFDEAFFSSTCGLILKAAGALADRIAAA